MMNVYGDVAINSGQLSPIQSKKELQLGFIPSSSIIVGTADGKMINSSNIARVYCSILLDLSKQGTEDIVHNNSTRLSDYIIHRYSFFERHSSHIIIDIENGSVNIHLLPLCSSIQDRKLLEGIKIKPNMARAQMLKLACDALGFTNRSKHIWPPEAVYSSNVTGTTGGSVCTTQQIEQLSNEAGDNVLDGDGMNSITSSSLISVLTPVSRKHKVASSFTTASDKESISGNLLKSRASVADSEAATTSSSLAYMIKCLPNTTSASFTKLQCSQGLRYLCEHAACGHVSVTCTAAEEHAKSHRFLPHLLTALPHIDKYMSTVWPSEVSWSKGHGFAITDKATLSKATAHKCPIKACKHAFPTEKGLKQHIRCGHTVFALKCAQQF
eukprot:2135-Heterococcus_DN1.PRE.1